MRCFIGLPIPLAVIDALQEHLWALHQRPDCHGLRWIPTDNWHITLAFLGEIAEGRQGTLVDLMTALGPAPEIRLREIRFFPGRRKPAVLAVDVDPLPDLLAIQAQLTAALRRAGFMLEVRSYRPHLSLARCPRGYVSVSTVESPMPITEQAWYAEQLCLYRSLSSPQGSRYSVLESRPFLARR